MKITRKGISCSLWDGTRVETGETIEVDDDAGALLVAREPEDWVAQPETSRGGRASRSAVADKE